MVFYQLFITFDVVGVFHQQTWVAKKVDMSHTCVELCSGGKQKLQCLLVGILQLRAVPFAVVQCFVEKNFAEFEPKTDCFDVAPNAGLETTLDVMSNKRFGRQLMGCTRLKVAGVG